MADKIEDSYSFSDDFYNFMNQMQQRSQSDLAPDTSDPKEDDEKDTSEPDADYDDLQKRYDDLQSENESLNNQIKDFRFADNPQIQSDDTLNIIHSQGGNDAILNMVLNDQKPDLSWAKKKSYNVNTEETDPRLAQYLARLPENLKKKVTITSGNDQEHAANSNHYKGKALDLRFQPDIQDYIENDPLAEKMGISVLNPNHGTAKHSHVQVKAYGGFDDEEDTNGTDLWNTNKSQWVDSVNNANMDKNFVKRLYGQNNPTMQVKGYEGQSTHLMGWDGNLNVAPQVVMMSDGKLHYLPTEDARDEYANKTGEFIRFKNPQQAEWYANNGYKTGKGVLNSISNGKPYNNPKYKIN